VKRRGRAIRLWVEGNDVTNLPVAVDAQQITGGDRAAVDDGPGCPSSRWRA